jgi:tetratricopeptide (TPR) repeat protein
MDNYQVSISMEPEKDNQGRDMFKWNLIRYEKKRRYNSPWSIHKQGFASSRIEALNEGIKAYDNIMAELSQLTEMALSVKEMFFDKNFEELRALANDPIKSAQLNFDSLLCVILAKAFKRESYQDIEELLKKLTLLYRDRTTIDPASMALITDERLASPTNVTALHKLAQICSLLSMMLSVNESSPELVNFFKEAGRVWRQRAVKPPVHTGKMLVTRAYDLMELGEKDKAEENVMMALAKGIKGDSLITAANVLKQVGQYGLAEKFYIKAIDYVTDEELKEYIEESLNKVREKLKESELILAAATRTDM